MEYVLWGTKKENEDWQEDIITVSNNKEKLKPAEQWAKNLGFRNLRTQVLNLKDKPNFTNTVSTGFIRCKYKYCSDINKSLFNVMENLK